LFRVPTDPTAKPGIISCELTDSDNKACASSVMGVCPLEQESTKAHGGSKYVSKDKKSHSQPSMALDETANLWAVFDFCRACVCWKCNI
jgi:hypothetical protein